MIVDPFCGVGSVPAMANAFGFDSLGCELSVKRAEMARKVDVTTMKWDEDEKEITTMRSSQSVKDAIIIAASHVSDELVS